MSINKNKSTAKEVLEQNDANLGSIKITWTYKDLRIESDDNTLLCLLADPTVNAVHPATNEQDYVMFTCTVQAGGWNGALPMYLYCLDHNKSIIWRSNDFNILVRCNEEWVFAFDEKIQSSDIFNSIDRGTFGLRRSEFFQC